MPARALHRPVAPQHDPDRAPPSEIVVLAGWTTDHRRMAIRLDPLTMRLVIVTLDWASDQFRQDRVAHAPGRVPLLRH